jgi:metal-responsive CopG/Arc/MetJ family transcriptional regulator
MAETRKHEPTKRVTAQLPQAFERRLIEAVGRSKCSRSQWVSEAVLWAIERDEQAVAWALEEDKEEQSATITWIYE